MIVTILYFDVMMFLNGYISALLFFLLLFFLTLWLVCLLLLFVLISYQLNYLIFLREEAVQHMSYSS